MVRIGWIDCARVLWETGVRVGEFLKLTLHSFDPGQKHVLIPTEKKKHLVKRRTGAGRPPRQETPMRRNPITSELLVKLGQYALGNHLESVSPLFGMTRQRIFQVVKEEGGGQGCRRSTENCTHTCSDTLSPSTAS